MESAFGAIAGIACEIGTPEFTNLGVLIVALVGILLTLGQLVLLRRELRLDALIKITDSNREILALGFQYPDLWRALGVPEGCVSSDDALVYRRYLQIWTNHMHLMWGARRLSMVTQGEWHAYREDMAELMKLPAFRKHWVRVERFYPDDFRRLVNGLQ